MKIHLAKYTIVPTFLALMLAAPATYAADPAPVAGTITLGVTVAETDLIATGWRASKLIGTEVYNDTNQKVGKIDDLVVATDGTLTIATVEVGGFLGMGKHLVAIPVKQFTQISPRAVLPGATKEQLKNMPEFRYAKAR